MRHQHAGLAIPDFPLAYGKLWPAMNAEAIAGYNARRVEITAANPITTWQIGLQLAHRFMAVAILGCVAALAWRARDPNSTPATQPLRKLAFAWLVLILIQASLGAWTIWSNKAADVATAHVIVGALSLVTGVFGCLICFRRFAGAKVSQHAPDSEAACNQHPPATVNP
jgi:cytochrome c oxidase assembly protein subunit 15